MQPKLRFFTIASVFHFCLLTACSPTPLPATPSFPTFPHHDTKTEEAKLKVSGIKAATFRLRGDLSFADAPSRQSTELKGTSLEHESVSYTLSFVNQRRVARDEALKNNVSCEIALTLPPDTLVEKVKFTTDGPLVNGVWSQFSDEIIGSSFFLQFLQLQSRLQSDDRQSFTLSCWNVFDLEQLRAQIGSIFEVSPGAEK